MSDLRFRCTSVTDGFCHCGRGKYVGSEILCGDPNGYYAPDYRPERCGFAEKIPMPGQMTMRELYSRE